jgi:hypothetical protein
VVMNGHECRSKLPIRPHDPVNDDRHSLETMTHQQQAVELNRGVSGSSGRYTCIVTYVLQSHTRRALDWSRWSLLPRQLLAMPTFVQRPPPREHLNTSLARSKHAPSRRPLRTRFRSGVVVADAFEAFNDLLPCTIYLRLAVAMLSNCQEMVEPTCTGPTHGSSFKGLVTPMRRVWAAQ